MWPNLSGLWHGGGVATASAIHIEQADVKLEISTSSNPHGESFHISVMAREEDKDSWRGHYIDLSPADAKRLISWFTTQEVRS